MYTLQQYKIFASNIESILLYGSKIWDMQCTEIVHVAACKMFQMYGDACNNFVLGDIACFPVYLSAC